MQYFLLFITNFQEFFFFDGSIHRKVKSCGFLRDFYLLLQWSEYFETHNLKQLPCIIKNYLFDLLFFIYVYLLILAPLLFVVFRARYYTFTLLELVIEIHYLIH